MTEWVVLSDRKAAPAASGCLDRGLFVLEFSLPDNRLLSRMYQWYFRNVLPRLGQLLVRNRQAAYEYLPQSVSEFPSGSQLTGLMEEAGLENTSFRRLTGGIATVYLGNKPEQA